MYKYGYFLLICFLLSVFTSCKKNDILLTEDTYTQLTIKHENFPDFSYAGYERSEKPVPLLTVKAIVEPGEGDDGASIQAAIDSVSGLPAVNGFRGAVLLKAGTYEVENTLYIRTSGVVLRGEGQGENGTVIVATKNGTPITTVLGLRERQKLSVIRIEGRGGGFEQQGRVNITANSIGVGSTAIPVANSEGFRAGDTIVIVKTTNDNWINQLGMAQYGWTADQFQMKHTRIIKRIAENTIYVDIPLVDAIEEISGGGYVAKAVFSGRISHSGVENMRLISVYENDEDEDHTWTAVLLSRAVNCWVRNITAQHFVFSCVALYYQSEFNTIQDCAMLDPKSQILGDRRYSFYIDHTAGSGNLFQRCYSHGGRHDYLTSAWVSGPNVFLDCYATYSYTESGPHHRWATGTLYDNLYADYIRAYNRTNLGGGHGWAGAQNMFWNCYATQDFRIESPPGAINWAIGCRGGMRTGDAYWASWGIPVLPRSLFMEQLKNRLGPGAVNAVTVPAQRGNKNIWDQLEEWAGNDQSLAGIQTLIE